MDVKLPDGSVIAGVPDGTTQEQLLGKLQLAKHPAADSLMKQMASEEALKGMGGLEKFRAGAGKAFSDLGSGAAQLVGMGPTGAEVSEQKKRDAALMNSGAGFSGNIAANVAALAPLMLVPGANTVGGAAAMGAAGGMLQPTESAKDRAMNMATGGALGGILQGVAQYPNQIYEGAKTAIKRPFQAAQAAVEPMYEGGREKILSRALAEATGNNRPQVIQNLKNSQSLVPGSLPTAAEVGNSGGLAAMQRSASAVDPEAYATRALQQNEARVSALTDLTGSGGARRKAEDVLESSGRNLYGKAREQGIDQQMAAALKPQMDNLLERMPSGVREKARELARLNGDTMDKGGSINGLHWTKMAVDDLLSSGKQTGIGKQTERALMQYKGDLLSVIDELSPAYAQARGTYQQLAKPINQMDVAQAISDKAVNKLTGALQPQAFARALSDDTAIAATGFNKATLANTMEPAQLSKLEALKADLARSVSARDLGRGAGSDTTQKLAMTNLMQRSGLPMGVMNMPGGGRVANWLYQNADQKMREKLSQALMDPKETARLMELYKTPAAPMGAPSQLTRDRAALLSRALAVPAATSADQR